MLYFVRSFFDYLLLQQYILRSFFLLQKQIVKKVRTKNFCIFIFALVFFCIFIFVYLIKMTI